LSADGPSLGLSRLAAEHLAVLLEPVPVGAPLLLEPTAALRDVLELLVPGVLGRRHPEWRGESLDGFRFSSAVKTGEASAELTGLCILISDQSVTPFSLGMRLTQSGDLDRLGIRLGEPGGGALGISGPAVKSSAASRLLLALDGRVESIDWVYEAEG
jgi:hypothetical protein